MAKEGDWINYMYKLLQKPGRCHACQPIYSVGAIIVLSMGFINFAPVCKSCIRQTVFPQTMCPSYSCVRQRD